MSASNPTTPTKHISSYPFHQQPQPADSPHNPTRIPQPSPQLIRRSFSLRLRNTTNGTAPTTCEICTKTAADGKVAVDDYIHVQQHTPLPLDISPRKASPPSSAAAVSSSISPIKRTSSSSSSHIKHSKSCPFSTMTHYCTSTDNKKTEIASPVSPTKKVQTATAACDKAFSASGDGGGDAAVVAPSTGNCVQHKKISNHCTNENGSVSCCCWFVC